MEPRGLCRRAWAGQSGAVAAEYLGVLLLVAMIVFAVAQTAPRAVACGIDGAIAKIAGGERAGCESERPPAPASNHPPLRRAAMGASDDEGRDVCVQMPSLCRVFEPPDVGVDLGDEETYDVTFGRGVYVSIYENATGAILWLYEICGEDIECLVSELEERGVGPQEGAGAAEWNDALDEDQWEDLEEAIRDIRENGGCLNLHKRSGINWSTRDSDDDTCRRGETFSVEQEDAYRIDMDRNGARITIPEEQSGSLIEALAAQCPDPAGAAGCLAFALSNPSLLEEDYPELVEELESSEAIQNLVERVTDEDEHGDLNAALAHVRDHGGCLAVEVSTDGAVDWTSGTPGESGCS